MCSMITRDIRKLYRWVTYCYHILLPYILSVLRTARQVSRSWSLLQKRRLCLPFTSSIMAMLQHTHQRKLHSSHQSQLLNSPLSTIKTPSKSGPSLWVMSEHMEVESQLIRPATHVGHVGDCCTPQIFQQLNGLRQTTHQMTGVLAFWHAWS